MSYKVLKPFDFYRIGQHMTDDDVNEQTSRGNMPDLVRNGFVIQVVAETAVIDDALNYDDMTKDELYDLAVSQIAKLKKLRYG